MCGLILRIPNRLAIFCPKLGVFDGDGPVDCRMTSYIRRIMRKCAQRESVLVDILTFEQQLPNKVSAANVVHQVAEFCTAEGVVAEILDDRASVGVGMCLGELLFGQPWISLKQEGPDLVGPH